MSIEKHRNMIPISTEKVLTRYMDLKKFEDLLRTNSLFFCRADKFSDPFEGSLTLKEYEWTLTKKEKDGFKSWHLNMKKFILINCWHINENESDAMWKLYLKSNEGVAIQTTVGKLCDSLEKSEFKFKVSKVRYIDYDKEYWFHEKYYPVTTFNFYVPLIHKRIEYMHENEFRILFDIEHDKQSENYWENEEYSIGKKLHVDICSIIDNVILAPTSDKDVREKVELIVNKYGKKFKIINSSLNRPAYF